MHTLFIAIVVLTAACKSSESTPDEPATEAPSITESTSAPSPTPAPTDPAPAPTTPVVAAESDGGKKAPSGGTAPMPDRGECAEDVKATAECEERGPNFVYALYTDRWRKGTRPTEEDERRIRESTRCKCYDYVREAESRRNYRPPRSSRPRPSTSEFPE